MFYETFELCESFDDVGIFCDGNIVILFSDYIAFSMPVMKDVGVFARQEEAYLLMDFKRFLKFLTVEYQEAFWEYWSRFNKGAYIESSGEIFTEGLTDTIHLQKHWEYIKRFYSENNISFWDYGMNGEKNISK